MMEDSSSLSRYFGNNCLNQDIQDYRICRIICIRVIIVDNLWVLLLLLRHFLSKQFSIYEFGSCSQWVLVS